LFGIFHLHYTSAQVFNPAFYSFSPLKATSVQKFAATQSAPTPVPLAACTQPACPSCSRPAACFYQPQPIALSTPPVISALVQPVYETPPASPPLPEPQVFAIETRQSSSTPPAMLSTSKSDILTTHSKSLALFPASAINLSELSGALPVVSVDNQPFVPLYEEVIRTSANPSATAPSAYSVLPLEVDGVVQSSPPTATTIVTSSPAAIQRTLEDLIKTYLQDISKSGVSLQQQRIPEVSDVEKGIDHGAESARVRPASYPSTQPHSSPVTLSDYLLMVPAASDATKGSSESGRTQSKPTITLSSYNRAPNSGGFQQQFPPNYAQILLKRLQKAV